MYYEDRSTDKLGVAYARPEARPDDDDLPPHCTRCDEPFHSVRSVSYCENCLNHDGSVKRAAPAFEDRPSETPLDREAPQQKVRAVLMTYCDPKLRYSGITAWEIAGKILDAIREEQELVASRG